MLPECLLRGSGSECVCIPSYKVLSDGACGGIGELEVHLGQAGVCGQRQVSHRQARAI